MYVINGNKNSPNTLLILSGIHGNEYSPCILSNKICNNIELISELKQHYNEIIFLSNINKEGLVNNTREFINIDLNRIYQYDFSTIDSIKKAIEKSTHIIDLHSSPHCDNFILINNTNTANSYVEYAIENDINYLIYDQYNDYTIKHQTQLQNKISITFEMNGINFISIDNILNAEIQLNKILKTFHTINVVKSYPKYKSQTIITAIEDGLHYINEHKQLVCLTLDNIEHIYNIIVDKDFIATYPIKSYYKKSETIILIQKYNQLI